MRVAVILKFCPVPAHRHPRNFLARTFVRDGISARILTDFWASRHLPVVTRAFCAVGRRGKASELVPYERLQERIAPGSDESVSTQSGRPTCNHVLWSSHHDRSSLRASKHRWPLSGCFQWVWPVIGTAIAFADTLALCWFMADAVNARGAFGSAPGHSAVG
jgi:hypothetical protein